MAFLVDRGGGLPPPRPHKAPEQATEQEQPDTRTELEKERDWNRKTTIAVGIMGVLPWVGLGFLKLFMCVPLVVKQKESESLEQKFQ